jgi:hypothetical protein
MISLLRLLAKVYRTISWFTSGKHGNRGLTAFSGIMLVMLGLCLAGPNRRGWWSSWVWASRCDFCCGAGDDGASGCRRSGQSTSANACERLQASPRAGLLNF